MYYAPTEIQNIIMRPLRLLGKFLSILNVFTCRTPNQQPRNILASFEEVTQFFVYFTAGDDPFSKAQSVWHYLCTEWAHANIINARVSAIGPLCKAMCSLSEEQQSKISWTDVQLTSKHDSLKAETLDNVEYTYAHIQLKKLKIVENNRYTMK